MINSSFSNSSENRNMSSDNLITNTTIESFHAGVSTLSSTQPPSSKWNISISITKPTSRIDKYVHSKHISLAGIVPSTRLWNKQKYRKNDSVRLFNMTWMLSKFIPSTATSTILGSDSESLEMIYQKWKHSITHSCSGNDLFSFCQHHSLLLWDSVSRAFHSYAPQPIPMEKSSYDLSFVAHTS